MSQLSIRLNGNQTPDNGVIDAKRPDSPPALPIVLPPIIEGEAAKLLQLILSGGLDLSAIARQQRSSVPMTVLEGLARQWLFDCRHSFQLAPGTVDHYAASLERFFNWMVAQSFADCGEEELRAFFAHLTMPEANLRPNMMADGQKVAVLSPRTRGIFYANLRVFFNWCVRRGYLSASPLVHIEPPRQKKKPIAPFSVEQIGKLFAAARQTLQGKRDYAILALMFDCGLRAAELCDLRLCDVDFEQRTIKVWHGKGNKERTVVFTPWTFTALWHYLSHYSRGPNDALFTSQRGTGVGKHLTPRGLHLLFKRLEKASGITGIRCSPHTMRHAFATYYIQTGGAMEDLQKLMGHETVNMSRLYVTQNQEYLKEKHIRHSPMNVLMEQGSALRHRRSVGSTPRALPVAVSPSPGFGGVGEEVSAMMFAPS